MKQLQENLENVQRQRNELRQVLREQKAVKEDSAARLAELQAQKEAMLAEAKAQAQEEVLKEKEVRRWWCRAGSWCWCWCAGAGAVRWCCWCCLGMCSVGLCCWVAGPPLQWTLCAALHAGLSTLCCVLTPPCFCPPMSCRSAAACARSWPSCRRP